MRLPYTGRVRLTSAFGERTDPITGTPNTWHSGVDLVGMDDKTILSPCDGVVIYSRKITDKTNRTWEWGNYVRIDTPDGISVYLCHLSKRLVEAGQTVSEGDPIGVEGSTGSSTGSHCHVEIRRGNVSVDPSPYLQIPNMTGIYQHREAEPAEKPGNIPSDWAEEAVAWAKLNEILQGDSEAKADFRLHDPVTREEMLVFLYRFARKAGLVE